MYCINCYFFRQLHPPSKPADPKSLEPSLDSRAFRWSCQKSKLVSSLGVYGGEFLGVSMCLEFQTITPKSVQISVLIGEIFQSKYSDGRLVHSF